jgi:hypothetical protein
MAHFTRSFIPIETLSNHIRRPTEHATRSWANVAVFLVLTCAGCSASLDETYYLSAFDPAHDTHNYFRIRVDGGSIFSNAKYSVGFYDRDAVERLFGEQSLEQEYLAAKINVFDDLGKRLNDISAQLTAARAALDTRRRESLVLANASVAGLIGEYQTRLLTRPELRETFAESIARATTAREAGEQALKESVTDPKALFTAMSKLGEAYAIMQAIRVAADAAILVRFFDGAGNEIDVRTKTQVIFVATDASRFAEAIRQLAEEEAAQQDLIQALLGPRIKEARLLAKRAAADDVVETALGKQMDEILAALPATPSQTEVRDAIDELSLAVGGSSAAPDDESIGGAP